VAGAPVISAYDVSKRFTTHRQRPTSLKERLVRRQRRVVHGDFWALRDISVQIAQGETVGLIGHNGSGKSTLLKLLAGILQPTTGTVHTLGRISSLLELGAGFAGELSGRDNIYLNASLLGLSRSQTDDLFDDIVAFSELGSRIDDPVKVYSSGMYVKLGFAVAVHVDPDILLIDEVLAVGDEAFQEKCIAKIEDFQRAGKTILVVSHGLDQIAELCTRVIVLDHGQSQHDGDPVQAVALLRGLLGTTRPSVDEPDATLSTSPLPPPADDSPALPALPDLLAAGAAEPPPATTGFTIDGAVVSGAPDGEPKTGFFSGEPLHVRVDVVLDGSAPTEAGADVTVVVMGAGDIPVWVMRSEGSGSIPPVEGRWQVDFEVPSAPAVSAALVLAVSLSDPETGIILSARRFEELFTVIGPHPAGLLDVAYTSRADARPGVPA